MPSTKYNYFIKHNQKRNIWSVMCHNNVSGRNTTIFKNLNEEGAYGLLNAIDVGWIAFKSKNSLVNALYNKDIKDLSKTILDLGEAVKGGEVVDKAKPKLSRYSMNKKRAKSKSAVKNSKKKDNNGRKLK